MPRYLLSVWHDDDFQRDHSSVGFQRLLGQVEAVNADLRRAGAWVFATGLATAGAARVIRARGDEVSMTDGPYAETKEQMGGFWVIEAADFDAALAWAGKCAAACEGPVEVRPAEGG